MPLYFPLKILLENWVNCKEVLYLISRGRSDIYRQAILQLLLHFFIYVVKESGIVAPALLRLVRSTRSKFFTLQASHCKS